MRAETPGGREYQQSVIEVSEDSIDSINKVEEWKVLANGNSRNLMPNGASPRENGKNLLKIIFRDKDKRHKVKIPTCYYLEGNFFAPFQL